MPKGSQHDLLTFPIANFSHFACFASVSGSISSLLCSLHTEVAIIELRSQPESSLVL